MLKCNTQGRNDQPISQLTIETASGGGEPLPSSFRLPERSSYKHTYVYSNADSLGVSPNPNPHLKRIGCPIHGKIKLGLRKKCGLLESQVYSLTTNDIKKNHRCIHFNLHDTLVSTQCKGL